MIAEAFGYVQFPVLPLVKRTNEQGVQLFRRNPKLCVPSHFDYSPYFEIIKYPFVSFSQQASHRLLPWKGNSILTGEEANFYVQSADVRTPLYYPSNEQLTKPNVPPRDPRTLEQGKVRSSKKQPPNNGS